MEAHEGIVKGVWVYTGNIFLIHICRHGIVDIKKCNNIFTDNGSDELRQTSVDIYLTRNRNSLSCKAAVDIAWNKSELSLEGWPAFSGDCNVFAISFVVSDPIL